MHLPVGKFVNKLIYSNATGFTCGYPMLLLTGNFTGMTAGAILKID
jgi:hypothetical protein